VVPPSPYKAVMAMPGTIAIARVAMHRITGDIGRRMNPSITICPARVPVIISRERATRFSQQVSQGRIEFTAAVDLPSQQQQPDEHAKADGKTDMPAASRLMTTPIIGIGIGAPVQLRDLEVSLDARHAGDFLVRQPDQGLARRHAEHLLQEDAVALLLPTRPYAGIVDAGGIGGTLSSQTKSTPRNQGFFTDDAV
jgi:hypothetical protein